MSTVSGTLSVIDASSTSTSGARRLGTHADAYLFSSDGGEIAFVANLDGGVGDLIVPEV